MFADAGHKIFPKCLHADAIMEEKAILVCLGFQLNGTPKDTTFHIPVIWKGRGRNNGCLWHWCRYSKDWKEGQTVVLSGIVLIWSQNNLFTQISNNAEAHAAMVQESIPVMSFLQNSQIQQKLPHILILIPRFTLITKSSNRRCFHQMWMWP